MAKRRQRKSSSKSPTPLDDDKALIDALVEVRPDPCAHWVRDKRPWPDLRENKAINAFVGQLTDAQRKVLAALLQDARDGGIHDTLAYLTDEIDLEGLRIVRNGRELPVEPFGTELYWDWTARRAGDPWPEPDSDDEA